VSAVATPTSDALAGERAAYRMRGVQWRDLAGLAAAERELFPHDAWTEQTWWAELAERPRRDYVVVEQIDADGGAATLAGYAGVDHGGDTADVMTVAVLPGHRGVGLGDRLVAELVRRASGRGAEALLLEVRADNDPALRLYARHGFELLTVRRRYYQPGDVDAHVLRRLLR